eukprot:Nitzschia sp. Nitz4//scaffold37_size175936//136213//137178//NITZ4_002063-RA/size175936-processed-gene-0.199-mRNA-1//1//CDS//3329549839//9443//frame0
MVVPEYDEASSSDDDSDSEELSSSEEEKSVSDGEQEESEDEQGDDDTEDDQENGPQEEDDATDLPLQQRLQGSEHKSRLLSQKRERRQSALEIASERLAKWKQTKRSKDAADDAEEPAPKKKKSKHAPAEVSSKRADFYRRGPHRLNESGLGVEIGANRYQPLDPRTNSLSGHLNEEQFETNYEFLQEMRNEEIGLLKKQIVARKMTGKKGKRQRHRLNVSANSTLEEDEEKLKKLKQEKADFERRQIERAAKRSVKMKIQEDVASGKGAFFLKRKEKKKLEFEAKMEELRKRGGHKAVEKALAKRRQKAKSRDAGMFVAK